MSAKPYLEEVRNDPESTAATIEFAKYLGSRLGASGSLNALRYYRDLNWISDTAYEDLRDYIQGLSVEELGENTIVDDDSNIEDVSDTEFGIHAESLRFIARISGTDFKSEAVNVNVAEMRVQTADDLFNSTADGMSTDPADDPDVDLPGSERPFGSDANLSDEHDGDS